LDTVIPVVIALIVATVALSAWLEHERRKGLRDLAQRLGLLYREGRDGDLINRYAAFDLLNKGTNRFAQCIFHGRYRDQDVTAFEFHYETRSIDGDGRTRRHHSYHTCVVCDLPRPIPEMKVRPEGLFDRVGATVGWNDIDVASRDFSERYHVSSPDEAFARAFFHAPMIQFFIEQPGLVLEIDGSAMMLSHRGKIDPDHLEQHLARLWTIRQSMPRTLLEEQPS